jgi:ubiquinone/menaquinone biosynthesis C-methylase UbiE
VGRPVTFAVDGTARRRDDRTVSRLLALIYDRVLQASEDAGLRDDRRALLAHARGQVLEIGAGTGLNLAHYPRTGVDRLVLSEPDHHMARRLRGRAADAPAPVEVVTADGEELPFGEASFDTVVATLVLCSVADPALVLVEVARVLRPGGRFLFLEHVRAHDAGLARWQDRLTPLWKVLAGNCHPNRSTLATLRASPLAVIDVTEGRIPTAAPIVRPRIAGTAERPPTVEQPAAL